MFGKSFKWFLLSTLLNQSGHIGFGQRHRLMAPDDGGGDGGGGNGGDPNKNADGSYKAEFVEKLLKEKNNHRDAKIKLEEELKALKGGGNPPPKKDDQGGGDDPKLKELLKVKDEEYQKTKARLDSLEKERTDGIKLGALREEFMKNGGDDKKFPLIQRLAETSKIIIDEDSGVVYGTEGEVKRIKELAPELFGKPKKGVNDGDAGSRDQHDNPSEGDEAFKKGLEGARLKKGKEGTNPFAALYAAKGIKVSPTKP